MTFIYTITAILYIAFALGLFIGTIEDRVFRKGKGLAFAIFISVFWPASMLFGMGVVIGSR